jgi:hypothetical protein
MLRRSAGLLAVLAGVMGLSGCGDTRPSLGTVHGKITLDGKPLAHAAVSFAPEGGGRASSAITDDQGNYVLCYLRDVMGAKIGNHMVRISMPKEHGHKPDAVPARYNTSTTLKAKVAGGDQVINFDLTTRD